MKENQRPIQIANAGDMANHAQRDAHGSVGVEIADTRIPERIADSGANVIAENNKQLRDTAGTVIVQIRQLPSGCSASIASIEEIRTSTMITISILLPAMPMGQLVT
jgi:hypothetical protein